MGELAAVTRVDGRTMGSGEPGPTTRKLSDLFAQEVSNSGYALL